MAGQHLRRFDQPQPHWAWAVLLIGAPMLLLLMGLVGLGVGSPISFRVAATAPPMALSISVFGIGAALFTRRRSVIAIAVIGSAMTVIGFVLLWVMARSGS